MTKPLLHIEKLVKRFGGLTATDHADLSVEKGKIHALIGPNGAGKTTLIAQISGAMPSDSGRIVFAEHDITKMTMDERARLHQLADGAGHDRRGCPRFEYVPRDTVGDRRRVSHQQR